MTAQCCFACGDSIGSHYQTMDTFSMKLRGTLLSRGVIGRLAFDKLRLFEAIELV